MGAPGAAPGVESQSSGHVTSRRAMLRERIGAGAAQLRSWVATPSDDQDSALEAEADPRQGRPPPEEALVNFTEQSLALGLGVLVLTMSSYAVGGPLACSAPTPGESARIGRCQGLLGNATQLLLPDFCWQPCQGSEVSFWCPFLIGLLLQAIMVHFSMGGCNNWLTVSMYFDPSQVLDVDARQDRRPAEWRYAPITYGRQLIEERAKQEAMRNLTKSFNSVKTLNTPKIANLLAQACIGVSIIGLIMHICMNLSFRSVAFGCEGVPQFRSRMSVSWWRIAVLVLSLCTLISLFLLQRKAQWHIRVTLKLSGVPGAAAKLEEQFKKLPGVGGGPPRYAATSGYEGAFDDLNQVGMMELSGTMYRSRLRPPHLSIGSVPEPGGDPDETVSLFFRKFHPVKLFDSTYRMLAIMFLSLAVVTLYGASKMCWTCVDSIFAPAGTSALALDRHLMLMGACGRHDNIGRLCFIASMLLASAVVEQLAICFLSEFKVQGHRGAAPNAKLQEKLLLPVVDLRKRRQINSFTYNEIGVEQPEVLSHVWVLPCRQGGESIMDCQCAARRRAASRTEAQKRFRRTASIEPEDLAEADRAAVGLLRERFAADSSNNAGNSSNNVGNDLIDPDATYSDGQDPASVEMQALLNNEEEEDVVGELPKDWNWGFRGNRAPKRRELQSSLESATDAADPSSDPFKWQRSKQAQKVRITHETILTQRTWMYGLVREEYNPPSICIEVHTDTGQLHRQIVPPEFISGHFHSWVNLGPKLAWEKMSGSSGVLAAICAGFDVGQYLCSDLGPTLSDCLDVLNNHCTYIHRTKHDISPISFRPSLGIYVAIIGLAFALLGIWELRVARLMEQYTTEGRGCLSGCCAAHCHAIWSLVKGVWNLAQQHCRSPESAYRRIPDS